MAIATSNLVQSLEVFLARKRVEQEYVYDNHGTIPASESPEKYIPGNIETIIRGPIDRQIETRTADGKRRITPKFLLPPERTPAHNTSAQLRCVLIDSFIFLKVYLFIEPHK